MIHPIHDHSFQVPNKKRKTDNSDKITLKRSLVSEIFIVPKKCKIQNRDLKRRAVSNLRISSKKVREFLTPIQIAKAIMKNLHHFESLHEYFMETQRRNDAYKEEVAATLTDSEIGARILAGNFDLLQIKDPCGRQQLAELILCHPWGAPALARNFHKFHILDPESRHLFAYRIAKSRWGAGFVAAYFENFEISDPDDIEDILLQVAKSKSGADSLVAKSRDFPMLDDTAIRKIQDVLERRGINFIYGGHVD